jgi:hypothetical protein
MITLNKQRPAKCLVQAWKALRAKKKKSLRVFIAGNIPAASGPAAKICPPAPPLKVGVAYPITVGDGRSQEVLP